MQTTDIVAATRLHVEKLLPLPAVKPWVETGLYIHTVLVETPELSAELKALFDEALLSDKRRLRDVAAIDVECLPDKDQFEERLHALA